MSDSCRARRGCRTKTGIRRIASSIPFDCSTVREKVESTVVLTLRARHGAGGGKKPLAAKRKDASALGTAAASLTNRAGHDHRSGRHPAFLHDPEVLGTGLLRQVPARHRRAPPLHVPGSHLDPQLIYDLRVSTEPRDDFVWGRLTTSRRPTPMARRDGVSTRAGRPRGCGETNTPMKGRVHLGTQGLQGTGAPAGTGQARHAPDPMDERQRHMSQSRA